MAQLRFVKRGAQVAKARPAINPANEYIERAMALPTNTVKHPYTLHFPVALKMLGYSRAQANEIIFKLYKDYWGESEARSRELAHVHTSSAYDSNQVSKSVSQKANSVKLKETTNGFPNFSDFLPSGQQVHGQNKPVQILKIKPVVPKK
jgi:predicted metal-dependent peptidase